MRIRDGSSDVCSSDLKHYARNMSDNDGAIAHASAASLLGGNRVQRAFVQAALAARECRRGAGSERRTPSSYAILANNSTAFWICAGLCAALTLARSSGRLDGVAGEIGRAHV